MPNKNFRKKVNQVNVYLSDSAFDNLDKIVERMNTLQALSRTSRSAVIEKILKDYSEMLAIMSDKEVKAAYLRNLIFEYHVNNNLADDKMKLDKAKINLVYETLDRLMAFDHQTRIERKGMNVEIANIHNLLKKIQNNQLKNIDISVRNARSSENIILYIMLALYNKLTVAGWEPADLESIAGSSQNEELNQLLQRIGDLITQDRERAKKQN